MAPSLKCGAVYLVPKFSNQPTTQQDPRQVPLLPYLIPQLLVTLFSFPNSATGTWNKSIISSQSCSRPHHLSFFVFHNALNVALPILLRTHRPARTITTPSMELSCSACSVRPYALHFHTYNLRVYLSIVVNVAAAAIPILTVTRTRITTLKVVRTTFVQKQVAKRASVQPLPVPVVFPYKLLLLKLLDQMGPHRHSVCPRHQPRIPSLPTRIPIITPREVRQAVSQRIHHYTPALLLPLITLAASVKVVLRV